MILIFVQTLVFVNNIHERPLRSLPFVPTHSPSLKLRLALACLCCRSWPITCLRCLLVFIASSTSRFYRPLDFIANSTSLPARLHRPLAHTRRLYRSQRL